MIDVILHNRLYALEHCLQRYDETADDWWKDKAGEVFDEVMKVMRMRGATGK